jgi:hypothetical protein
MLFSFTTSTKKFTRTEGFYDCRNRCLIRREISVSLHPRHFSRYIAIWIILHLSELHAGCYRFEKNNTRVACAENDSVAIAPEGEQKPTTKPEEKRRKTPCFGKRTFSCGY